MSPALLAEKDSSHIGGVRSQRPRARQWKEDEAQVEEGLGLLGRPDTLWLIFLPGLFDLAGTENSYEESLPLLGCWSGLRGSALLKLV